MHDVHKVTEGPGLLLLGGLLPKAGLGCPPVVVRGERHGPTLGVDDVASEMGPVFQSDELVRLVPVLGAVLPFRVPGEVALDPPFQGCLRLFEVLQ